MQDNNVLEEYLSVVPTVNQKGIQRHNFNVFFHYGLNTFTSKEWGDGKVSPKLFNPVSQDTDQWIKIVKDSGAYGVILTCKHHDGFCLWQTKTTDYSVASSPYKGGKGDVVKEVSDSCKKYGIKFGIYLSPWDRNHIKYGTPEYNDVYCQQLKELLTNYGDIFCVWLDGACGAYMDGKPKQIYDWERYYSLIRQLAPNACISNCGPDIRWVGNEGGFARESEWNVVPRFACDTQTIQDNSQQQDDASFAKKGVDIVSSDLGSRKFLAAYSDFMWYPAEVDVSIRPGWFYHKSQNSAVRSLNNLLNIYYKSVCGNSLLLLNIPPDRRGLIHEKDANVMRRLGSHIKNGEKDLINPVSLSAPEEESGCGIDNAREYKYDNNFDPIAYYTPLKEQDKYNISIKLDGVYKVNRIKIVENTAFSQRIENFEIYAYCEGKRKKVYDGTVVGYCRMAVFKAVKCDSLDVIITSSRKKPYIEYIGVYKDNGFKLKYPLSHRIKKWIHRISYKTFIDRENKKNV